MVDSANESVARLRAALAVAEREGAEAVAAAATARAEVRNRGAEEDAQLQRLRCAEGHRPCSRSLSYSLRRPRARGGLQPAKENGPCQRLQLAGNAVTVP